jgi:D-glycero-alpha-D-manno-heptose-7-phosphate kinase
MKIIVKSPTRVDFAGGTLDLWPLFNFIENSKTINAAIDIYTKAELTKFENQEVHIEIDNVKFKKKYKNIDLALKDKSEKLDLIRPILEYFKPSFGFHIKTSSESPVGGGLGGSSSLMISIITAFCEATETRMPTLDLVRLAHNMEAQVLKKPTGTQDYIPPIEGGVNLIHYGYDDIKIEKLFIPQEVFDKHFLLVYTGKPHHSGFNNWQVLKKSIDGHKPTLRYLSGLRDVAHLLLDKIQKNNWDFKDVFKMEYKYRSSISKSFSSAEIKKLEKIALKNGAQSIKICGAGGGGCVIVWCMPGQKEKVMNACQKKGFQVLKAKIVDRGISIEKQS